MNTEASKRVKEIQEVHKWVQAQIEKIKMNAIKIKATGITSKLCSNQVI